MNHYTSSLGGVPANYAIWNAGATYRLFEGNTGEVKFSAMDLLHQNKGVINNSSGNTLTRGTVNALQQYFMLTFSWFPRRFGRRDAGK